MLTPQAYDPLIRWETTVTYNLGMVFGFFNDRLTGSIDAYVRDTKTDERERRLWGGSGGEKTVYFFMAIYLL